MYSLYNTRSLRTCLLPFHARWHSGSTVDDIYLLGPRASVEIRNTHDKSVQSVIREPGVRKSGNDCKQLGSSKDNEWVQGSQSHAHVSHFPGKSRPPQTTPR